MFGSHIVSLPFLNEVIVQSVIGPGIQTLCPHCAQTFLRVRLSNSKSFRKTMHQFRQATHMVPRGTFTAILNNPNNTGKSENSFEIGEIWWLPPIGQGQY